MSMPTDWRDDRRRPYEDEDPDDIRMTAAAADAPLPAGVAGNRSHATRILHLAMLLIVLHQLIGSLIVERPLPGDDPDWPYLLHEWIGLAGFGVVALFWAWAAIRNARETHVAALIPWLSAARRRAIGTDLAAIAREIMAGRPPSDSHEAFASAIHGLGLIVVSVMVVSGASWYLLSDFSAVARPILTLHKMTANLMWAYLIGHAGIAVMHHLLGSNILSRMFWWRTSEPPQSP
ncbi:MAG: cytochrome b/b6 domain-containing protein [Ancalomicrobiaceae bacterium]|nr:cytochrome b/b6 domain-containing protein [Ancalomicrobiaceae bacterium]